MSKIYPELNMFSFIYTYIYIEREREVGKKREEASVSHYSSSPGASRLRPPVNKQGCFALHVNKQRCFALRNPALGLHMIEYKATYAQSINRLASPNIQLLNNMLQFHSTCLTLSSHHLLSFLHQICRLQI
jgi:hypothetical protein